MRVIGLLGGIASGKSLVAQQLEALGALRLDADRVGHEVLLDPQVEQAVRQRWGADVFDGDGRVDRRKLAAIVFAPPPEGPQHLADLEKLTHPRIAARLQAQIAAATAPVVVLDAAVMLKGGWDKLCDEIWFVDTPRDQRIARARQYRGWTEQEFSDRENAQEPIDLKRKRADRIIDNSGSPEQVQAQVARLWQTLTS